MELFLEPVNLFACHIPVRESLLIIYGAYGIKAHHVLSRECEILAVVATSN